MNEWWKKHAWRLIQTNLREIDMRDINAKRFVDDLKSFDATVVMINAAGIIASYPTKLPVHFQSPFLTGDSLSEIIEACHKSDIRVIARTDFSKIRRPIYEAHPDWAYLSPEGKIVDYNGDVHTCINGQYQRVFALKIIEEVLTTLDFDGIFFNMGGYQTRDYSGNYYGICHCANCRRMFHERFGAALPAAENMDDPVYRKYLVFKRETLREHKEAVDGFIHALRPDICIDRAFELGEGFIRQESNTAVDRPLPHWQYSGSENTKWAVSSYPGMISTNTTVDFIDFPYRHVAVSPAQQKLRLIQSIANGGVLDYYLMGRLDNHEDRSGFAGIKEVYNYHRAHEADYRDMTPCADVALLKGGGEESSAEYRGWYRFLSEGHFLFDTPVVAAAEKISFDRYKAVVLPDLKYVSDSLAAKIDAFTASGGVVIATGQSGFFDEKFERRQKPVLASLGIENVEHIRQDMSSSYFKLSETDKNAFGRFSDCELVYFEPSYVFAGYRPDTERFFRLIPPHDFGPPEKCYYETILDRPGVTRTRNGKGLGVYLPWTPGALFHRQGYLNTFNFAQDLLEHVAGIAPLGGILPPSVEVTRMAKRDGSADLIHLINQSGHFGVSFFDPLRITKIELALNDAADPRQVRSLTRNQDYTWRKEKGRLLISIPELDSFEAIKISW